MGHSWRLRLQRLRCGQHFFGVAASIGLARWPDSGSDMKTLFGLVAANLRRTFDQKTGAISLSGNRPWNAVDGGVAIAASCKF
jgi:hypothetical protein